MVDAEASFSVEVHVPFLTIRANNIRINRVRRRFRSAGPFLLVNRQTGLALDATWGTAGGTKPHLWQVHSLANQLWYLRPAGQEDQVHIISANNNLVLDAGRIVEKGARPQLWPLGPEMWKLWTVETAPSGRTHRFRSCASGLVLDSPHDAVNKTPPVVWDDHGGENQQWLLMLPIGGQPD